MTMTGYLFKVCSLLTVLTSVMGTEDTTSDKDHPTYKYGYVISHIEGGSQAHLETRNGSMTLGRYYVNFPNGSGQKVTYLADDVGYHTGVSYNSQTKKGSTKTRIAMGHKALATLENLDGVRTSSSTPKTDSSPGNKASKEQTVAIGTETQSKINQTLPKGFYLLRSPVETATITSNHLEQPSHSVKDSQVQQSIQNLQQTLLPTSEKIKLGSAHLRPVVPEIKNYIAVIQPGYVAANESTLRAAKYQTVTRPQVRNASAISSEKSIEKTIFSDFDAQLISKIQKHADGVIMNDLRTSKSYNVQNSNSKNTLGPRLVSTVTMQPIVVAGSVDAGAVRSTELKPAPQIKKLSKTHNSATINSLVVSEKNGEELFKKSGVNDVTLTPLYVSSVNTSPKSIDIKLTSRNSDSGNSTLCDSGACEEDSNRAYSDTLISIKPRKDITPNSVDTTNPHKSNSNFYPRNRQKEERHYVTTIDVQKGISLDVQHNEDGSIQLASNFPFNKLPKYQRPYNSLTPEPLQPNYQSSGLFSPSTQNVNLVSEAEKSHLSDSATQTPLFYDNNQSSNLPVFYKNTVTANPHLPIIQENAVSQSSNLPDFQGQIVTPIPQLSVIQGSTVSQSPNVPVFQDKAVNQNQQPEFLYRIPQIISHQIPQSNPSSAQIANSVQTEVTNVKISNEQVQQQTLYSGQHGEPRKQSSEDDERKEYIENIKKVEEIKQQNAGGPNPEIEIPSNGLLDEVTASPVVPADTNPVKATEFEGVAQHVQFIPEVHPSHYQNDVSNSAEEVSVPHPYVHHIQNSAAVYQKPIFAYAPQHFGTSHSNGRSYYGSSQVQNVYIDNNLQQVPQKLDLSQYSKIAPLNAESRYAYQHPIQAEEKVQQVQSLASLPHERISTIPINAEQGFLTPEKVPQLDKTLLLNPIMTVPDYSRAFKLSEPVSLLDTYPMQFQAGSEQVSVPAFYQLPQQYQILPFQLPQAHISSPQPTFSHSTQSPANQYHVTMSYRGTNKLRIQPLKPSPPPEEDTQAQLQSVRNILSQPQFQTTYFYAGYPTERSRLQLRHISRKKVPDFHQIPAQSLTRKEKSLKNLRIEYGFKPPLKPSVEFTEEVKPSIYGPSVPQL